MSNVPMSNPELMLACVEPCSFSRGAIFPLKSGRIMAFAGKGYSYSDDGGLTWATTVQGRYHNGEEVYLQNALELADGVLGAAQMVARPGARNKAHRHFVWTTSEDQGKTWSDPKPMGDVALPLHAFQNVLTRTSNGRLIMPMYFHVGQGRFHDETRPFVGGWVDGEFVSTDAHYFDPHFSGSVVVYSDDGGKTWEPNRDGELFVHLEEGGYAGTAEPSVVEVEPGKLLMMQRTRLGRAFHSWSYDNGETWTRPMPTHLAASNAPVIVTRLPATGHLLCLWNQMSAQEIHDGYIRSRLSAAISRNGGGIWEFFQNVESIHEQRQVEPGPIRLTRPQNCYAVHPGYATGVNPAGHNPELDPRYGRWTNHSVCPLQDRVLIAYGNRCKVLSLNWFYRGREPKAEASFVLNKLAKMCPAANPPMVSPIERCPR